MLTHWGDRFNHPSADLAIIGGGLIGTAVAWYAVKAGLKVAVFERAEPPLSSSSLPSGLISPLLVAPPLREKVKDNLILLNDFLVEKGEEKQLNFSGSLLLADPEDGATSERIKNQSIALLETFFQQFKEAKALQWLSSQELQREVPNLSSHIPAGVFCPQDAWINPLRLLKTLIEASLQQGVVFHFHSPVIHIIPTERSFGIETPWETFPARRVVITTGVWSRHLLKRLGVEIPLVSRRVQSYQTTQGLSLPYPLLSGVWVQSLVESAQKFKLSPSPGGFLNVQSLVESAQKASISPQVRPILLPGPEETLLVGEYLSVPGFDPLPTPEGTLLLKQSTISFYPPLEKAEIKKEFAFLGAFSLKEGPLRGPLEEIPHLYLATGYGSGGLSVAFAEARSLVSIILEE